MDAGDAFFAYGEQNKIRLECRKGIDFLYKKDAESIPLVP